jgi:nitrite reductase/ring-hydroxylating ferredoxin subunit
MPSGSELTTVSDVRENRSFLFTATDEYGAEEELLVVPCDEDDRPVRAFANRCTHEAQRLDTGRGVAMRDGQIICPKHGSMFDACSGYCDNGDAADTTLPDVDLAVADGAVFLTDDEYTFAHEGGIDDGDDAGPSSTSHIGF